MKTAQIRHNGETYQVEVLEDLQVKLPNGEVLAENEVQWSA